MCWSFEFSQTKASRCALQQSCRARHFVCATSTWISVTARPSELNRPTLMNDCYSIACWEMRLCLRDVTWWSVDGRSFNRYSMPGSNQIQRFQTMKQARKVRRPRLNWSSVTEGAGGDSDQEQEAGAGAGGEQQARFAFTRNDRISENL